MTHWAPSVQAFIVTRVSGTVHSRTVPGPPGRAVMFRGVRHGLA